jgi:flagellar export protein FliJ
MSRISSVSRMLDFRRMRKEEIEIEAKKAWQALRDEEEVLGGLEKSLMATEEALAAITGRGVDNIHELGLHYDYISTLDVKINRQRLVILKKTEELEAVQARLVEAYRDMKMVEILRERLIKERDKGIKRLETRHLDSIWNSRAAREAM